jgi:hypothetical protein
MESKKKNKKSKGGSNRREFPHPLPGVAVYKGPLKIKSQRDEVMTEVTTMNFTGLITSTAGGVIDSNYTSDPNSYGLTDWTNLVALYHEYRTLGIRVEFYPYNRYSKTTVVCTPAIAVTDHATPTSTLGGYQTAMSHESAKKVSWEDPWVMEARMSGIEESGFISTAGTTALFSVKYYSDGLSVSTVYGRFFVYVVLEMRGRK